MRRPVSLGPDPPISLGEIVRSSSSIRSSVEQGAVELWAALGLHISDRWHDLVQPTDGIGQIDGLSTGSEYLHPRFVDLGRLGGDQEPRSRGEQRCRQIDTSTVGDDPDPFAGRGRWSVAFAASRPGTDQHHVADLAQGHQDVEIIGISQPAGRPVDRDRPVEAGDHAQPDPRTVRPWRALDRVGVGDRDRCRRGGVQSSQCRLHGDAILPSGRVLVGNPSFVHSGAHRNLHEFTWLSPSVPQGLVRILGEPCRRRRDTRTNQWKEIGSWPRWGRAGDGPRGDACALNLCVALPTGGAISSAGSASRLVRGLFSDSASQPLTRL